MTDETVRRLQALDDEYTAAVNTAIAEDRMDLVQRLADEYPEAAAGGRAAPWASLTAASAPPAPPGGPGCGARGDHVSRPNAFPGGFFGRPSPAGPPLSAVA